MSSSGPLRILVVDDSQDTRNLMVDVLSANHKVEVAQDGAEALSKYSTFKPNLTTLDISMPVMNGLEALSKILTLDKEAKIVMTTALEHDEIVTQCLQKGAIGYITKPFAKQQLLSLLENLTQLTDNKNVFMLFNSITSMLDTSIRNLIGNKIKITLKAIEVKRQESSRTNSFQNIDKVYAVSKTVSALTVNITKGVVARVSDITGQCNGQIISYVTKTDATKDFDQPETEFFNIVNMKVFSALVDATGLRLAVEPIRQFDKIKDNRPISNEIIHATYTLTIEQECFLLKIQLCFNEGLIHAKRF